MHSLHVAFTVIPVAIRLEFWMEPIFTAIACGRRSKSKTMHSYIIFASNETRTSQTYNIFLASSMYVNLHLDVCLCLLLLERASIFDQFAIPR
jgi:hypothetical protein